MGANSRANMQGPLGLAVVDVSNCDTTPACRSADRRAEVSRAGARLPLSGLARVRGGSMAPTLRAGDLLLVRYAAPVRPGALVLARFADGTLAVKRAVERRTTARGRARLVAAERQPRRGRRLPAPGSGRRRRRARRRAGPGLAASGRRLRPRGAASGRTRRGRGAAARGRAAPVRRLRGSSSWLTDPAPSRPDVRRPHPLAGDPVFDLHVGGKMEIALDGAADRPRRPVAGLHPGRGPGLRGDRRRPGADPALHLGAQHGRGRHRRHGRARPRRHRPGRRDAGDGGQGGAVQAVRRRRRRPDLPGHHRRRGDHRDRRPAGAELRRDQPRGHLGAPLLRDRGAAQGAARHPGLPRRPARHGRRGAGRADERAAADRPRPRARTRVVISGAGAAGVAVARILLEAGVTDLAVIDRQGVLHSARGDLTPVKRALARRHRRPTSAAPARLADALDGADVYIGVSGGTVPEEVVATMAPDAIIFGLANPTPEVHPDVAHRHARVVATGRSDFPNQINNVLAFPGIFRGAFDVHATAITEGMKLAAADALADLVGDDLRRGLIIPSPFDPRVGPAVPRRSPRPPGATASPAADGRPAPALAARVGSHVRRLRRVLLLRRPAVRPGGRGAARARGPRRLDHGHRQGRLAQPPRPVVAARRRAARRRRCR